MSDWINLGSPYPKEIFDDYEPIVWDCTESIKLSGTILQSDVTINKIVENRRTLRDFKKLEIYQLGSVLWLTHKILSFDDCGLSFPISYRPVASAGAIHPITILVNTENDEWFKYDGLAHALRRLANSADLVGLRESIKNILDPQDGIILFFVAEPGKTLSKYSNGISLIWRDAGVILGHIALLAESYGLSYCPLGLTGDDWVKKIDIDNKLAGVGMAIIGAR